MKAGNLDGLYLLFGIMYGVSTRAEASVATEK